MIFFIHFPITKTHLLVSNARHLFCPAASTHARTQTHTRMMCSGPFRGAQGHNWLQTCTEGRDHIGWKRGEVVADDHCWILQSVLHCLFSTSQVGPRKPLLKRPSKLLVWGRLGTGGLGAPGPDGPVLKVAHLGAGGGWGLGALGPMGRWSSRGYRKLRGPVRKPMAAAGRSGTTSPRFQQGMFQSIFSIGDRVVHSQG